MKVRMGTFRALGLGAVASLATAGLSVVAPPTGHAADPVLPAPDSPSWIAVKRAGNVATDPTNDFTPGHLNLTPAGGALAAATAFVSADLQQAYFRFHVAELPTAALATDGYVVQFDTDGAAGWERAIRFEPVDRTIEIYTGAANSAPKAGGTLSTTVPLVASGAASYTGVDGGAFVAFSVPRTRLTAAGINLGAPMVMGASNQDGAALDGGGLLGIGAKADILGVGKGAAAWASAVTDPPAIDSDGDGFADNVDNCPVTANPGQEDDDKALDNTLPPEPVQNIPDGTEGQGNACDPTPRGYDSDEDGVGYLDDQCVERPGVQENGCPAHDATVAVLRYNARKKVFSGEVRGSVYDECGARRNVTVLKYVAGPDRAVKTVRSDAAGKFSIKLATRPKAGKYYAHVDPKNNVDIGLLCFADNSPKIQVS